MLDLNESGNIHSPCHQSKGNAVAMIQVETDESEVQIVQLKNCLLPHAMTHGVQNLHRHLQQIVHPAKPILRKSLAHDSSLQLRLTVTMLLVHRHQDIHHLGQSCVESTPVAHVD
ncbi:Uncharacterised protein [Acinetobacter baumannii]|nr:Uncharacterised protein [Acinetobacter baumannii]